jgi:predicted nucleotidyltransferase
VLQGKFGQRDYFIRCIKEQKEINETYGSTIYEPAGEAKIKATIADNSEMIYTPCRYQIETNKVLEGTKVDYPTEIVSFRGRFCDQAQLGEEVISRGKVERVQRVGEKNHHYRVLLGNKPSDFMTLA